MTDQSMAQQVPAGEPVEQLPSTEQTPSTQETTETVAPSSEAPVQENQGGLPEGVKERTRQEFEKLTSSNSELATQLREERARRQYAESVFQQFTPRQPVIEAPKPLPIVDPTTGLVNENALAEMQRSTQQAQQEAKQAATELQQYRIDQEKREAFTAHPELDPKGKSFNKEISIETRKVLLDNMTHPEDYEKSLTFKEAADVVKARLKPMIDKAQQQGAKQAIEQITPKEQAALEVTGTPTGAKQLNTDEIESLRYATRKGGESSEEAIVRRMRGLSDKS